MTKQVSVKFFASFKERLGVEEISVELAPQATVGDLISELSQKGESWQKLFSRSNSAVKASVNFELADSDTSLHDGDEVAFFPPVTGG